MLRWRRFGSTAHADVLALLRYHRSGLYCLAIVVGVLAGGGAILFRLGIDAWADVLAGGAGEELLAAPTSGLLAWCGRWFLLAAPVISGLLIGPLMWRLGRTSTGHGVSGVIWSARRGDGTMAGGPAATSVVSAILTIGGGGSVGPEGPIAELGASTASLVGKRLGVPARSLRLLAAAGTAAGIASAFNAPLAGVFFAMEVILVDFTADAFAFMVLACVSSTVLTHQVLGEAVTMALPPISLEGHSVDSSLGWAALLGIVGGIVGVTFSRCRYLAGDAVAYLRERIGLPVWLLPGVGGLLIGGGLLLFPQSFGESSLVLEHVFAGSYDPASALGLALLKTLATALTLACGFAGGVFAPSLFVGGSLGAAFGMLAQPDFSSAPAIFGVLGMCAVFTGAGRAPITAVILIIEMTGLYSLLLPLMLVSVLATFISRLLTRTSIYTEELRRRGEDVDDPLTSTLVGRVTAREVMTPPPAVLLTTDSLPKAARVLYASGSPVLPVVLPPSEEDASEPAIQHLGRFVGCVSAVQVAQASVVAEESARSHRSSPRTVGELPLSHESVRASEDATSVLGLLVRKQAEGVPVLTDRGGEALLGWISQQDMVRRLYRHQREAAEASRARTSLGARAEHYWHTHHPRR